MLMLTGQRRVSRISQYHLARLLKQNFPRPPYAQVEKLTGITLRAYSFFKSKKFRILPIQKKKITILSLHGGIGKFLIPGRKECLFLRESEAYGGHLSQRRQTNMRKLRLICREKKWKILNVERFRRGQTLLTGLSSHCFKQQKEK